jgi:hypothetical protein
MVRLIQADELQVGDIVHLQTDTNVVRIELTEIIRRTRGYKCVGYRAEDLYRVSPWSFGFQVHQMVTADEHRP